MDRAYVLAEIRRAAEANGGVPRPGFNHYDKADTVKVDKTVEEVSASDYDALVLPGGVGNPDTLRMNENAVHFVREFFEQGKPVGAICHAPGC